MLSLREGVRGARASTQSARLLRESEAAPTVSPIVTVHIGARPQACRSSENTVQQIMVRVGVGPTPMLAMRKLIIPAGHRALVSGVRVRKRSGAGRGRGARRRRGTCGARMPNGWPCRRQALGWRSPRPRKGRIMSEMAREACGEPLGGKTNVQRYTRVQVHTEVRGHTHTHSRHPLPFSVFSPSPSPSLCDSRNRAHSVLSCFAARRPVLTRSEVSTEHKKAPFPPGGPSFSFTNKVQASIHTHMSHRTYPLDGAHPHLPPSAETTRTG